MAVASAPVSTGPPLKLEPAVGAVNVIPPSVEPVPLMPTTPLFTVTVGRTNSNCRIASSVCDPLFVEPSDTWNWFVRLKSLANGKSATTSVIRMSTVVDRRVITFWNEPKFSVIELVVGSVVMNDANVIAPTGPAPLKVLNDLFVWMNASPALTVPEVTRTRIPVSASVMESKSADRFQVPGVDETT